MHRKHSWLMLVSLGLSLTLLPFGVQGESKNSVISKVS